MFVLYEGFKAAQNMSKKDQLTDVISLIIFGFAIAFILFLILYTYIDGRRKK